MERRKLRRRALFSSKYLLVSPSTERLSGFEAEHSHPPPNTHARTTHGQRPPLLLPFPTKAMGCHRGDQSPRQCVGAQTCVIRLGYKAETKTGGDPLSVPRTQVLVYPLSWFCLLWISSKLSQTAWGWDKHFGNSWR